MMNNKDVVEVLNDLVQVSKDGEEGFKTCAEDAKSTALKTTFMQRAQECAKGAHELQQLVIEYGGDPEMSSSVTSSLHRRWIDFKTKLTGKDDEAILNECERGEDIAVKSYREALEKELPSDVRSVIERQFGGVQKNHDEIKMLRDRARMAS